MGIWRGYERENLCAIAFVPPHPVIATCKMRKQ
jgi:hypothetical protein